MWHEWTTQLRGLRLDWGCAAALTLPVMHMPTDEPHKRPASHTFLNTHTPTNKGTPLWMHKVTTVRTRTHKRTHRGIICATEFWTLRVRRRLKNCTHHRRMERAQQKETKHTHTHTLECELPVCWAAYWTAPLRVRPARLSWQPEQWEGRGNRGEKKEQKEKVRRRAEE